MAIESPIVRFCLFSDITNYAPEINVKILYLLAQLAKQWPPAVITPEAIDQTTYFTARTKRKP